MHDPSSSPETEWSRHDANAEKDSAVEIARAVALAVSLKNLKYRKIALYGRDFWNPKQLEFGELKKRERLFMAGNQYGKTHWGGFESSVHLTGEYPEWWKGHRFDRPISMWVSGVNGAKTRDNPQLKLFGRRSDFGSGFIPKARIAHEPSMSKGTTGLIDQCEIDHVSGGKSIVKFMTYDMDDEAWESDTLHFIWGDEEPPENKYTAGLARLTTTFGLWMITFTPLNGMSSVVSRFFPIPSTYERGFVRASQEDAIHIPVENRKALRDQYKLHERRARVDGFPTLGSGAVYDIPQEQFQYDAFKMPSHWPRIRGLDIGGSSSPTAWVEGAWDRDDNVLYITHCYSQTDPRISTHAASMVIHGKWVPVAWPHDAHQHDRSGDGLEYAQVYRQHGVNMLPTHAQFDSGGYQTEPGVSNIYTRIVNGRMKVARHLNDFWQEYHLYHRKEGRIVKENDHIMDAWRCLLMMIRYASTEPNPDRLQKQVGMDYNPLVQQ